MYKALFNCAVALALSACTTIPVSSMYKLSRIDFMTSDLSRFRLALLNPDAISPRPNGVKIELITKQGESAAKTNYIYLEETLDPADMVGLPNAAKNQSIHSYRMRPQDQLLLQKLREEALAKKTKGEKGSLTINLSAKEFCRTGPLPKGALYVTTFIATVETDGYVTMTKDVNLRDIKEIANDIDNLPMCGENP